jgi:hypothetical protein
VIYAESRVRNEEKIKGLLICLSMRYIEIGMNSQDIIRKNILLAIRILNIVRIWSLKVAPNLHHITKMFMARPDKYR